MSRRIHPFVGTVGLLLALSTLPPAEATPAPQQGALSVSQQDPQAVLQQVSAQQIARDNQRLSRIKDEMDILRAPSSAALANYLAEISSSETTAKSCVQVVEAELEKMTSELMTLGPAKKGEPADVIRQRNKLEAEKTQLEGEIASCRLALEKVQDLRSRITQLQHQRIGQILLATGPSLGEIVRANLADPGHLWSSRSWETLTGNIADDLGGLGRAQLIILGVLFLAGLVIGYGLRRLLAHLGRTRVFDDSPRGGWNRALLACGARYPEVFLVSGFATGFFFFWSGGDNPSIQFIRILGASLTLYFPALAVIRSLFEPCAPAAEYWPVSASLLSVIGRRLRFLAFLVLLGVVGHAAYRALVAYGSPVYPEFLLARKLYFLLLVGTTVWITWLLGRLPLLRGTASARVLLIVGLLVSLAAAWSGYANLARYVFGGIMVTLLGLGVVLVLIRLSTRVYDGLDEGRHHWQRGIRRGLGVEPGSPVPGLLWLRILTGLVIWGGFLVLAFNEWNPFPIGTVVRRIGQLGSHWQTWLLPVGALIGAMVVALIGFRGLLSVVRHARRPAAGSFIGDTLLGYIERPLGSIFPLVAVLLTLPVLTLPPSTLAVIHHLVTLGLIAAVAWLLIALMGGLGDFVAEKYRVEEMENLRARRLQTQSQVLRRIGTAAVGFIALAGMLMTFPNVRQMGISLFASAGVAGLVAGLAARPVLTNILAGVQIALTEPIRIEDVVVVQGEWGRIEEINMTYVVVRLWDLRRLVVPLSYFIEQPFQNWTRVTADILGYVYVYTDYSLPVPEVRKELRRILETSGMWDGKVCVLQVTNATDRTMELRALMSAPNSGTAWDLRCYVRERLIAFVRERYPESLPRTRAELRNEPSPELPAPGPDRVVSPTRA